MKYYDIVISLGQNCATSNALRACHLQEETLPFDWSGGVIPEKCGKGGLSGKVDLIINGFKDFFKLEDLENRGNNAEDDVTNLWIVNKRTGLQYRHDFPDSKPVEDVFPLVKEKYQRRVDRLNEAIEQSNRILFVYFAKEEGFEDDYLIEQQVKLQNKYPDKTIDFFYIMNNTKYQIDEYDSTSLTPHVFKIICNFTHPTNPKIPQVYNGNTKLYYPIIENLYYTPVTVNHMRKKILKLENDIQNTLKNTLKDYLKIYGMRHIINFKYCYYRFIANCFVGGGKIKFRNKKYKYKFLKLKLKEFEK